MGINRNNILFIYNSNSSFPDSLANVQAYVTARGLADSNGYFHSMGFNFGSQVNTQLRPAGVAYTAVGDPTYGYPTATTFVTFDTLNPTAATKRGTGATSAYSALTCLNAIGQFILDQGIDMIIVENRVPPLIDRGPFGLYGSPASATCQITNMATETVFASAVAYMGNPPGLAPVTTYYGGAGHLVAGTAVTWSPGSPANSNAFVPQGSTQKPVGAGNTITQTSTPPSDTAFLYGNVLLGVVVPSAGANYLATQNRPNMLVHGRLGYDGCSAAEVVRCFTDAIAAEKIDNRAKFHLIGGNPYFYNNIPYDNVTCNWQAFQHGFSNLGYFDLDSAYPEYSGTKYSYAALWTNKKNPLPPMFGMIFGAGVQPNNGPVTTYNANGSIALLGSDQWYPAGTNIYAYDGTTWTTSKDGNIWNNAPFMQGGWCFNWQSSAALMGRECLSHGGCAAVLNHSPFDPSAAGIPDMLCFFTNLLYGLSIAEACYFAYQSGTAWCTVYGDPLYAPYKQTAIQVQTIFN